MSEVNKSVFLNQNKKAMVVRLNYDNITLK